MNTVAKIEPARQSLIATMASEYHMDPKAFADTVRATCMPPNASNEEFAAFLMVAKQYSLNPITREIYAFPKKGGGIQPIVGIDGWMNLINSHPSCDGMDFKDEFDPKGELASITCTIHRKDRQHPTMVTEYMTECKRPTEPWTRWPARMLRHKAAIQCARYAFGFAGIIDPEEAERSPEVITGEVTAPPPPAAQIAAPGRVSEPANEEDAVDPTVFDSAAFFDQLEADLVVTNDLASLEEAWVQNDPESTFDGDDLNLEIAQKIKARHEARINAPFPVDTPIDDSALDKAKQAAKLLRV
jgi:phage recombination protein Bet